MKIRKGFISNSSSSSFVIYCDDRNINPKNIFVQLSSILDYHIREIDNVEDFMKYKDIDKKTLENIYVGCKELNTIENGGKLIYFDFSDNHVDLEEIYSNGRFINIEDAKIMETDYSI